MSRLDALLERSARGLARGLSRRSFLARLGRVLIGGAALPLLPVSRALAGPAPGGSGGAPGGPGGTPAEAAPRPAVPDDASLPGKQGDPSSCEYWRHCAIDGFLCSCCGGSQTTCPPGTTMAPVTWIGTCRNPADGVDYVISYNDCCGKDYCGRCMCNRNEGDKPAYVTPRANDINWCLAAPSTVYHCSTAIVVGVATAPQP